jgi:hypothetical protein
MTIRILILFGLVFSSGNVLPCEKLNSSQIKDYYFSAVTADVERMGMLCVSQNSKISDCTQKDKHILQDHWNIFIKNSNLNIVGRVLVNKQDGLFDDKSSKTCSYYVRIAYPLKNEIAEIDDQLIPATRLIFMEKYFDSQNKVVTGLEKNNWLRINIQDTTAKNSVGQDWSIAPVLWSVENFRRYSLLNRVSRSPGLSNEAINKLGQIKDNADDPGFKKFDNYFNRQYN